MSKACDEEMLYNELKTLPDFECMPIPNHWYKKFGIEPRSATTPKEFIESNYTLKMASAPKDLPAIILDEPQQNGKLVEMKPPEDIKVEVQSRPFTDFVNGTHPSLLDPTTHE
jgi:hypothetical protein